MGLWACQVFIYVVELDLLFFLLVFLLRANVFAPHRFIQSRRARAISSSPKMQPYEIALATGLLLNQIPHTAEPLFFSPP